MIPARELVGRRNECEELEQLLADVRAQQSRVLVLRGEAGIGKTALLDHLDRAANGDCLVLRAMGVESEMELAFAGLHQLCAPLLGWGSALPAPQQQALGTAFGLSDGEPADRFLVGLAVLSLLAAAAEERPIVCLIDDVQWMDEISAQTLAFVARRLLAEPVALVFAVRQPIDSPHLDGLPERVIGGLPNPDAQVLLDMAKVGRLDERVRDRILAETRGNPLALLELPRGLSAAELAGGFALPVARPLAGQIEETFMRRVEQLPEATRRLLLVAAAEPLGDAALLQRAAKLLGISPEAITPAEDDGLIEVGIRVHFRHPLVRAAAYRVASATDRRVVHQALAEATAEEDPDRQAWHRAHAAAGPDEAVAEDLERSAERAKGRGGYAAAAAFLERAVALTSDPAHRSARSIAAAEAKYEAAALDAAEALLATADMGPLDPLHQARSRRLRAQIGYQRRRGDADAGHLLDAARELDGLDDDLARDTYLEALGAAIFAGRLGTDPCLRDVAEGARSAVVPAGTAGRPSDLMLAAVTLRFTDGYVAAVPELRYTIEACRVQARAGGVGCTRWFWLAWLIAGELWDDGAQHELATMAEGVLREAGALAQLPHALIYGAVAHIYAGELDRAEVLVAESAALCAVTGNAPLRYADAVLVAWRGIEDDALELMQWNLLNATERGEGRALAAVGYVLAVLYNGLARYEEAMAGVQPAFEHDDLLVRSFALPELIEAAARSGATERANDALAELEVRATASGTDWALGLLARSRALLSDGEVAEAHYREAIERLGGRTRVVLHLARAHLVYGEWLRRENRRSDAREHLRTAHEIFVRSRVEAFVERARRELVATGERAVEHHDAPQLDLTPQESQIAVLAAAGRTNPDGSELFISPRTVEYHLSKVFSKLGVSSRRELRRLRLDR